MALLTPNGVIDATLFAVDDAAPLPARGRFTVSAKRFSSEQSEWTDELRGRAGVHVEPHEDIESLGPMFADTQLVVLGFSKMTDGRPYSQARLLRKRLGYGGELVARGPLIPDQFAFLRRCGFDAVEVPADVNPEVWQRALRRHRHAYQPDPATPRA